MELLGDELEEQQKIDAAPRRQHGVVLDARHRQRVHLEPELAAAIEALGEAMKTLPAAKRLYLTIVLAESKTPPAREIARSAAASAAPK